MLFPQFCQMRRFQNPRGGGGTVSVTYKGRKILMSNFGYLYIIFFCLIFVYSFGIGPTVQCLPYVAFVKYLQQPVAGHRSTPLIPTFDPNFYRGSTLLTEINPWIYNRCTAYCTIGGPPMFTVASSWSVIAPTYPHL